MPPLSTSTTDSAYENASYYSSCNSDSSRNDSFRSHSVTGSSDCSVNGGNDGTRSCDYSGCEGNRSLDSAYNSGRNSPAPSRTPVCYATVTYFNVNDSEDSSSIRTEYTILELDNEFENDECTQNAINENIEIVSTL